MLTLATGQNKPLGHDRRDAGFSLMEMLVVVFIIAMASTAVVLTLPEPTPDARKHADALARELVQAGRESIISGEPIALTANADGYRFQRYRGGEWLPMGTGKSLSDRATPEAERTRLAVTSLQDTETARTRSYRTRAAEEDAKAAALPDVIFYPVGEATPAEIVVDQGGVQAIILVSEDASVRIAGQGTGS